MIPCCNYSATQDSWNLFEATPNRTMPQPQADEPARNQTITSLSDPQSDNDQSQNHATDNTSLPPSTRGEIGRPPELYTDNSNIPTVPSSNEPREQFSGNRRRRLKQAWIDFRNQYQHRSFSDEELRGFYQWSLQHPHESLQQHILNLDNAGNSNSTVQRPTTPPSSHQSSGESLASDESELHDTTTQLLARAMTKDSLATAYIVQRSTDLFLTQYYHIIDYEDRVRVRSALRIWQQRKPTTRLPHNSTQETQRQLHPSTRSNQSATQETRHQQQSIIRSGEVRVV